MSPTERREMLIAATIPLLARHGLRVTTKHIAEAAGVAEGTIFRVFTDKDELVKAAIERALDPEPAMAELRAIDMALPLRVRVRSVVMIMQRRFDLVFTVMMAVRAGWPPGNPVDRMRPPHRHHEVILAEMERVLARDRDQLRIPAAEVVRIIRLLTFSASHPLISDGRGLSAEEITTILLDGVLRHEGPCAGARTTAEPESSDEGQH
jgi:AcrR family transcriptional regulator